MKKRKGGSHMESAAALQQARSTCSNVTIFQCGMSAQYLNERQPLANICAREHG